MKFNMVNKNKLQIIISEEDLKNRNMEKWDTMPNQQEIHHILHELLEEAREACGFDVGDNAQLMIEAFPMTGKSMLITVTKVGEGLPFGFPSAEQFREMTQGLLDAVAQIDDLPEVDLVEGIFRFENLENAIQLAQLLADVHYSGESQLFRYQEQYYLAIMEYEWLTDYGVGLLEEYSVPVNTSVAFFREHGECIMEHKALDILSKL